VLPLAALGQGCKFEPVVRTPKPEQLSQERTQVLSTLDTRGEYALVAYQEEEQASPQLAISHWRTGERCDLPVLGAPVSAPLPRARGAPSRPMLYLPLAVSDGGETQLMLVDDHCQPYGPFGAIAPDTARTVFSDIDQGGYLLFRDPQDRLSLLDPRRGLAPRALADGVSALRATRETRGKQREAVWIIAAGELRLLTLDGEPLAAMGHDVNTFNLASSHERIAFVDGEDLYEAAAPSFAPRRVARDACGPRYGRDTLEFFAPCAEQTLQRVGLESGEYQQFEPGVFASFTQEGVRLDYSTDEAGDTLLSAVYRDGARVTIDPVLDRGDVYVIDDQRLAGLAADEFGIWTRADAHFSPLVEHVAQVIPHHRGKKHTFAWLLYHDVDASLGTLSLLDQGGAYSEIAQGVPLPAQQGFVIEDGSALAQYPFAAPLVVLLEDAYPMAQANAPALDLGGLLPERFCGRLKALSITGAPRAELADDVCSYAIVAAPVPGVLYGVEAGADQGLWFVAL
jgi:hypothetical protein